MVLYTGVHVSILYQVFISLCIVGESSQAAVSLYVLMNVRMSAHISRATYRVGTVGE